MDILKAEIAKKRQLLETNDLISSEKKYFKREDLYSIVANQQKIVGKQNTKNIDSTTNSSCNNKQRDGPTKAFHGLVIPRKEVIRRLRLRDEPIRLFGENDIESYQRLRKIEILRPEVNEGMRNDFKEAMDQLDKDFIEEASKDAESSTIFDIRIEESDVSIDHVKTMAEAQRQEGRLDHGMVLIFLKFLLRNWAIQLNERPSTVKRSAHGKLATATHSQTSTYLQPLFLRLKNKTLDDDILDSINAIVLALLERDYVLANDHYLQMAIGNAPWPMGVTMVGIHARPGREKVYSKNVAHVLNDETQRKYIQGLKRLMTFCQKIFKTTPSRSFEYNA